MAIQPHRIQKVGRKVHKASSHQKINPKSHQLKICQSSFKTTNQTTKSNKNNTILNLLLKIIMFVRQEIWVQRNKF